MSIKPEEIKIVGQFVWQDGKPFADAITQRIYHLLTNYLIKVTSSDDGWNVLYIDKTDGRYWELSYPNSWMHGGGEPQLEVISYDKVATKYKILG